jgi:hypothetical protein
MKTAMQTMYDELMKHEYTIPLELIIKCKELIRIEKLQLEHAQCEGAISGALDLRITPEQYYNETYGGGKQ